MKKRILYSLLAGFILMIISLAYKSGSSLEPMPYFGNSANVPIANGVVAVPPSPLNIR